RWPTRVTGACAALPPAAQRLDARAIGDGGRTAAIASAATYDNGKPTDRVAGTTGLMRSAIYLRHAEPWRYGRRRALATNSGTYR
ncbi:hypothetical protein, partial [Xanthomonas translucens]|uniref:hypothetical protein n=1 Tax=Xanthomonas campestris pv. translucens TaxID=343 RepID=UPI001E28979A